MYLLVYIIIINVCIELLSLCQYIQKDVHVICLCFDFFKAGADIKEMVPLTYQTCLKGDFLSHWSRVARCRKPVIAAVNGFAVSLLKQEYNEAQTYDQL